MRAKDRRVGLPRFGRCLVERTAHGKEQLRWLADDLVAPIYRERDRDDDSRTEDKLKGYRHALDRVNPTAARAGTRPKYAGDRKPFVPDLSHITILDRIRPDLLG